MSDLRPCANCPLKCPHHDNPMCVRNLIHLAGESAPITLGMHLGLNHVYGEDAMPPCVRGPVGSAYWSNEPGDGAPPQPVTRAA